ncbi:hypothetical protein ZIOFF_042995 [Zingiber officinale]|uniref:Uncharacterized protein n=1 Tax=Zingiber officinale TaxID=94328 RepID=A0A8J5FYE0_ZINOF|nr:hypothetical protein ZIOFF_042995 [Zingiber officinale]
MAEAATDGGVKKATPSLSDYNLDPKLDACLDLSIRRFLYSSLAGASAAVLFFRSRTTRWASVAFGAGAGVGSAYTECSYILDGYLPKWSSYKVSAISAFYMMIF